MRSAVRKIISLLSYLHYNQHVAKMSMFLIPILYGYDSYRNFRFHVIIEDEALSPSKTVEEGTMEYRICNTIFQVKIVCSLIQNAADRQFTICLFVRFASLCSDNPAGYMIKLSSVAFNLRNVKFVSEDVNSSTWRFVAQASSQTSSPDNSCYEFDISTEVISIAPRPYNINADDFDFELKGEGGSVKMHKVILAAASPVFGRMFSGPWIETIEGSVNVTDTSRTTLQHLKEYLYLHQLPSTGLEELLELAQYYMMTELKDKCIGKLINALSSENLFEIIALADSLDIPEMTDAIYAKISNGSPVKMRKDILATASPVINRMLSGPWSERTEGSVDVTDASGTTLQDLQEFQRLQRLSSTGLKEVLKFAQYYMMRELEDTTQ